MIRTDGGKPEGSATTLEEHVRDYRANTAHNIPVSASADHEFNMFKAEQRTLLEERNQIQKRIESMKREYDFISNLDARDVNFVIEKKKEHAALLVQRNWRRMKAEREYRRNRQGMNKENFDYEKTELDKRRQAENSDLLEKTRAYFMTSRPDNFYAEISDDRLNELKEEVVSARQLKSEHELNQLDIEAIHADYLPRYQRFNQDYEKHEYTRAHGHD